MKQIEGSQTTKSAASLMKDKQTINTELNRKLQAIKLITFPQTQLSTSKNGHVGLRYL